MAIAASIVSSVFPPVEGVEKSDVVTSRAPREVDLPPVGLLLLVDGALERIVLHPGSNRKNRIQALANRAHKQRLSQSRIDGKGSQVMAHRGQLEQGCW